MGTFAGHFFPAMFYMMYGLYAFFRALRLKCTDFIRTTPNGILGGPIIGLFGSGFMIVGEYINSSNPFLSSHMDHFKANFAVFVAAAFMVLHAKRVLTEAFWGLVPSVSFLVLGVLMGMHPQPTLARRLSHDVFSALFNAFAVAYAVEYIANLYILSTKKAPADVNPSIAKLHPAYTNPHIYKTVFPMLTSYTMLVNAVYWMIVSFNLFYEVGDFDSDPMYNDEHMAVMAMADMVYASLLFTAVGMGIVAYVMRSLEGGVEGVCKV